MPLPAIANTKELARWQPTTRFFHWAIALLILLAIALGFLANEWNTLGGSRKQQYLLFMLHKSLGLTVLLLAVGRVIAKFRNHSPPPLSSHSKLEQRGAHFAHLALYILMFSLPLTGWWLNSVAGVPLKYFLLFEVPSLTAPQPSLESLAALVHTWLAMALIGILLLHLAGTAKHHCFDKDSTLSRMLPTGFTGAAIAIAAALLTSTAAITGGYSVLQIFSKADKETAPQMTAEAPSPEPEPEPEPELKIANAKKILLPKTIATAEAPDSKEANGTKKYAVLPDSQLSFEVIVLGQKVLGTFKNFDAKIRFNPNKPELGSLNVTINTASAFTDNNTRDEMLPEPAWFSANSYPQAHFKTLQIAAEESDYIARSELTIRGVTQPLDFEFSWEESDNGLVRLNAKSTISRIDFNIGAEEFPDEETVGHNVTVMVKLKLKPEHHN